MIELNLDINRLTAKRNALISEVQELEKQRDSIYNDISDQRYSKTIVQSEKD